LKEPFARLFIDVSYTRTQLGSIGITRTVRCLADEFMGVGKQRGWTCQPVVVHSSGYRELPKHLMGPGAASSGHAGALSRVVQWTTSSTLLRRLAALVPMALLNLAWRLHTRLTFDALSRTLAPVQFRSGDVLFLPDAGWQYAGWRAAQLARKQGARVVLMVHDLIPLRHANLSAPLISKVFGDWLTYMLPCADAIVCNSRATQAELEDHAQAHQLRLPPTRSFRLGADLARPTHAPQRTEISPPLADFLRSDSPLFAAVGSFEPRKNYAWLVQVFERLWAAGHDVRLLIMGRPTADSRALIDGLLRHPEQGRRLLVVLDGSDEDLAEVYARARALLFPSMAEGFGLPMVEARTRGCLVIASDLPVFHELADAGVSLYPKNSIEGLEALVLAHAAVDRRTLVGAMPAFTWRESVEQLLKTVTIVLDPLAGP
jgi:glycosyltransferase involved in cell wall biosynthesis